jgi:outer membrane biosynthesis protein TonB
MNLRRCLTPLLSLCLVGITSGWAQEAIEPLPTEEPVIETKPAATEEPQPTPKPEPKPAKRSKEKSGEARASRDVQDSMTAQEFKSAGLDKLSESELQNLNAWLQGYRQKAETKAAEVAVTEAKQKSKSMFSGEAILSRVNDDNFAGVTGRSIITLEDGTVWKQANPDDRFKAQVTNHPPVRVSHGSFGYKMHIVGVPEFYVDPVRK